mgnify:CR=1 FL=1
MPFNITNFDGKIICQHTCIQDSNLGYFTDFSVDGEVDGWTYYDGIHTYGCWNNFLFGTLYGSYGVVGRANVFRPVSAETFISVKIVMRLSLKERADDQLIPSTGRVRWTTLNDAVWNEFKQLDFDLICDDKWHTYVLNMGESQWWIGDINNLRVYPILNNGKDGDEFLIKSIEIISANDYLCSNVTCSFYNNYQHPCGGVGLRASCSSKAEDLLVQDGTVFGISQSRVYTIEEGVNDELLVSINGYGFEIIKLPSSSNNSGERMATIITNELSKTAIGGYAEASVEFTNRNQFIIYSGTYTNDSLVEIGFNNTSIYLGFFDDYGIDVSTKTTGETPASGFAPLSSFKIQTYQLNNMIESTGDTSIYFNPNYYSVEGGRADWLNVGIGITSKDVRGSADDQSSLINRNYTTLNNVGKTIIDFNHPFNSSGRITKIYAAVTLDNMESLSNYERARGVNGVFGQDLYRETQQLSGAKIMFFRPTRDGNFKVLPTEINIIDRDYDSGKIYAQHQEYVEIDCDLFVNKGDFIGIYNANVYVGKTIAGKEVDALYYQVEGKASGVVVVSQPSGYGQAGLLFYARGVQRQNRLFFTLDLGKRTNVKNINVFGEAIEDNLEYNIARCLDINWEVDMFGGDFTTSHVVQYAPSRLDYYYNHPSVYYGKNCLNDGIKVVPDGLAGDSFSVEMGTHHTSYAGAVHQKDGGRSVIVNNAKYFQTNGDCEWLAVYYQIPQPACPCEPKTMLDFSTDPIAFTLKFPYEKEKLLYKSKIFFKERYNFRSFAISLYKGDFYSNGNADDPRFDLIPYRTDGYETPWSEIILDGNSYTPEESGSWELLDLYLAHNPCVGGINYESSGIKEFSMGDREDFGNVIEYDPLGGMIYYETGSVTNNEQYIQATTVDWSNIVHRWEPIRAKGYRFYCDYHESTKICEFEVYCAVENFKPSLAGTVGVSYSSYGDVQWISDVNESDDGVSAFIGDTPRYINIEITPITEIKLKSLGIDVSSEDVYMGDKGCDFLILPENSKMDSVNESSIINFKNVYNRPYDLYVDIDRGSDATKGLIFYSKLNNINSITNPIVGSDAYYKKQSDYPLLNYQGNVAINCPVYALKNLVDGAKAWYSYDDEHTWNYFGELTDTTTVNVSNIAYMSITTITLPTIIRSKWWKFGFYDKRISMNIREIKVYYQNQEISGVKFYHHKGQTDVNTSSTDVAVHLDNSNAFGSYYVLNGSGGYIGIELPGTGIIDKIVMYNDTKLDYEKSNTMAGIDFCTGVCIHGDGDMYQTNTIKDSSYYEHEIQTTGSGIYCDTTYVGLGKSGIRFSGYSGENLIVKYANNPTCNYIDESFDFDTKRFTIDFFIKFNLLPTNGNKVVIAKSWLGDPLTTITSGSWALTLENVSGSYRLRFYINNDGTRRMLMDYTWALSAGIKYHVALCRGPESSYSSESDVTNIGVGSNLCYYRGEVFIDGCCVYFSNPPYTGIWWNYHVFRSEQDVKLGENLNGWIDEFRISSSYTPGGGRLPYEPVRAPIVLKKSPPTQQFEKYTTFSIYTSEDNFYYGKLVDVDAVFTTNYSYYTSENCWSRAYNSYFAIDLGQRHDIEIIRSFPVDTAYQFTLSNYIRYSNNDTDDITEAFKTTEDQLSRVRNMSFTGEDFSFPKDWSIAISGNAVSHIKENKYYQHADGINSVTAQVVATSLFYIVNAFDIQIDFELDTINNNNEWLVSFSVTDMNNANNVVSVNRSFLSGSNQYSVYVQDNSGTATKVTYLYSGDTRGSFRIWRDKNSFIIYIKRQDQPDFQILYSYRFLNSTVSNSMVVKLTTTSQSANFPPVKVYWDKFEIIQGDIDYYSTYNDARWLKIVMANDGTTRTIKRIGVYPDVSSQESVDLKHNTYWNYLGESITNYTTNENIAFGVTVSGSSEVGLMRLENITDGIISTDLNLCWGSDDSSAQWIIICLTEIQSIYRIKIHHGYDGVDTRYIINDYTIQVSTNGINYTTIFTITNNTSFTRTHDLSVPIDAKFIKINISEYTASINKFVWINEQEGHQYWKGAVLREVEIYKYYGFSILNSESTPIIAIDLRQNYFVSGHSLLGIDTEDTWTDWDNSNSNFAYSNSNLSDPSKVSFGEWGMVPDYERWVVIKRNTATKYPTATEVHPAHLNAVESAIPDYLKHVIISAASDEIGTKPNPTEYPWMWRSSFSELSYDYDYVKFDTNRSLRINYPSSSGIEHVYNIEGDHFGTDASASWRDGCGFSLYIDDVDNLDLTYGYFYLGGHDYTIAQNIITYRWNFTSISGSLQSGWNTLNLTFMYADSIEYTAPGDKNAFDVRRLYSIKFSNIGIVFRGSGNSLRLNLDGFHIQRNHFEHSSSFDYGLYLHDHDFLKSNISGIDFHDCTIEFFIRPDWDWTGRDFYNDFKHRTLFHLSNTSNDVFGASISQKGLEIYYGNIVDNFNLFIVSNVDADVIDKIFHTAFVFSNDGSGIDGSGSTIHFYIDNVLVAKTSNVWAIKDSKHFYFIFGGQGLLNQKMSSGVTTTSAVDAVISNLKIYNYCKTNFEDSLNNTENIDNSTGSFLQPNKLIEISSDNLTFYKVGSADLPFIFDDVTPNTSIPIYVRTIIPKTLIGKEKRTAAIIGSWDVGV